MGRKPHKRKINIKTTFSRASNWLIIGGCYFITLDSGWYEKANIVAQAQSSPFVLFIAIAGIVAFTGFFYKKFRWEMNEQAYRELKLKDEINETETEKNI